MVGALRGYLVLALVALFAAAAALLPAQDAPLPTPRAPALDPVTVPRARLAPADVRVGEIFQYVVESPVPVDIIDLPQPDSNAVTRLRNQPNRNITSQIIGDRQTSSFTYTWPFQAMRAGDFTIAPLRVRIGGREAQVRAVKATVRDVEAVVLRDGETFGHLDTAGNPGLRTYSGSLFTQIEVSNLRPYLYEPVLVTTYLYMDPELMRGLGDARLLSSGGGRGFYALPHDLGRSHPFEPMPFNIDNRRFSRVPIRTTIMVPTRVGETAVEGPEVGVQFSASIEDAFFRRARSVQLRLESPRQTVEVRPIPAAPAGTIAQLVGSYTIGATVDRNTLREGELVTLTVNISGEGFLETVSLEKFPEILGLDLLSEEVDSASEAIPALISRKTFKLVFQASRDGTIMIPSLRFAVFNHSTDMQRMVETEPIALTVEPGAKSSLQLSAGAANGTRGTARQLGEGGGILYIDTTPLTRRAPATASLPLGLRPSFWAAHLVPLLLLVAWGGWNAHQRRLRGDEVAMRSRESRRRAEEALREARHKVDSASAAEFYAALSRGVLNHAASLLRREAAGLTADEAVEQLRAAGADETLAKELRELLEQCDAMRYAPTNGGQQRGDDLQRALRLVQSLTRGKT